MTAWNKGVVHILVIYKCLSKLLASARYYLGLVSILLDENKGYLLSEK
ncbi:MAG: hypothetical protein FD167_320 [bacterium]|nr:MAG: hypothetical protein FD167_320 [bacterium]